MQNYRHLAAAAAAMAIAAVAALAAIGTDAAHAGQSADQYCGAWPAPGFDQPPNHAHTGRYVNAVYGYAVTIPAGLTAYTSVTGPERGFGIVLSWTPRVYLRVDAAYDAFYDITASGVHLRDLVGVRLFDTLLSDQAVSYSLVRNPGDRFRMRVQCAGSAQVYLHDDVIAMRKREIYRLDLQSAPERYAADVKLLNAMLRTWQWLPIRP